MVGQPPWSELHGQSIRSLKGCEIPLRCEWDTRSEAYAAHRAWTKAPTLKRTSSRFKGSRCVSLLKSKTLGSGFGNIYEGDRLSFSIGWIANITSTKSTIHLGLVRLSGKLRRR